MAASSESASSRQISKAEKAAPSCKTIPSRFARERWGSRNSYFCSPASHTSIGRIEAGDWQIAGFIEGSDLAKISEAEPNVFPALA